MALLFGESVSADRLTLYLGAIADVPVEALRAGTAHAMQTRTRFPKPAELRADVDAALSTLERLDADLDALRAGELPVWACTRCDDTGWVFVAERTDHAQPTVKRCHCYETNPVLAKQRTPTQYAKGERR